MLSSFYKMLSYPFLVNALIVGILVSLCAALLGVTLVLKRYSMIGESLSHVGFAALAIAYAMNAAPLTISLPVCVLAAFLLLRLNENHKLKGDAATAILCSGALAVGVMTVSLTTGMNTDVCNYMFGSILAMSQLDVRISILLSIVVLGLYVLFYHKIFAVTFDENFAKATGIRSNAYTMLLALLTAITVVLGMRIMGTLLISSLIIFPALTSMRVCRQFKTVILCSVVVSTLCFIIGITISYLYSTPTGASIVICNLTLFLVFSLVDKMKGKQHKLSLKKGSPLLVLLILLFSVGMTGCSTGQNTTLKNRMKKETTTVENSTNQDTDATIEEPETQDDAALSDPEYQAFMASLAQDSSSISADSSKQGGADGKEAKTDYGPPDATGRVGYHCDIEADKKKFNGTADIVVGDHFYATQINDWYLNFDQYEGKTVEIEGYYIDEYAPYTFVGRYGPSCPYCNGGYVSFEFYTKEDLSAFKSVKDWIKVKGILRQGEDSKGVFYYIEVLSLEKMDQVGKDTVTD